MGINQNSLDQWQKKEDYTTSSQTNANDRILHQYYRETMLGRMTSSTKSGEK